MDRIYCPNSYVYQCYLNQDGGLYPERIPHGVPFENRHEFLKWERCFRAGQLFDVPLHGFYMVSGLEQGEAVELWRVLENGDVVNAGTYSQGSEANLSIDQTYYFGDFDYEICLTYISPFRDKPPLRQRYLPIRKNPYSRIGGC